MNIYKSCDYRKVLKLIINERKKYDKNFGFHQLADAAKIQRPYISKVMNGNANLSQDQLFDICNYLNLKREEQHYLQLCLEKERTGLKKREKEIVAEIEKIISKNRDSGAYIEASKIESTTNLDFNSYYLDPMLQIIHVSLSIEYYSLHPDILAVHLKISPQRLIDAINKLKELNMLKEADQRLIPLNNQIHLPKSSPLYQSWRNQVKLLAMQKINDLQNQENCYSFTSVFSANEESRKIIMDKFLEFLSFCEKVVQKSVEEQSYQMSFDFFPWTTGGPKSK